MKRNWFVVDDANMAAVAKMFKRDGFKLPSPRCFGRLIRSFNLNLLNKVTSDNFHLVPRHGHIG